MTNNLTEEEVNEIIAFLVKQVTANELQYEQLTATVFQLEKELSEAKKAIQFLIEKTNKVEVI